jgi:uncharacterized phage protein gp47/JayE
VKYARIGQAILDVPGVSDYSGLTVNSGTGNVQIAPQDIAVPGTYTLT